MDSNQLSTKDKRAKREIANSNERRRMQSINAGFQELRRLLPVNDGEKMSKAAILRHATEIIRQMAITRGILINIKNGMDVSQALGDVDPHELPDIPVHSHMISRSTNNKSKGSNKCNDTKHKTQTNKRLPTNLPPITPAPQPQQHQHHQQHQQQQQQHQSLGIPESQQTPPPIQPPPPPQPPSTTQPVQPPPPASRITITSAAETNSDRVTSPKACVAKAAIALPIEVPYNSETAIRVDHHHHDVLTFSGPRKVMKTETLEPAPKGQNLDTICKAIMEIEGDRVFNASN